MNDPIESAARIVGDYADLDAAIGAVLFVWTASGKLLTLGQDMRPLREKLIDAVLAAGYRKAPEPEWEYAIQTAAGEHAWPFGPQDEELAETYEACVAALDGNDPDFWDPDDHVVRRVKAGPWLPVEEKNP